MRSDWTIMKLSDIAEVNPREMLSKGTVAKKVAMDKLQPFCRDIPGYEMEAYMGGAKFRNGDTIMARITPCLENGKTAKVAILDKDEIGFGSTEYIVFRAKKNVDEDYLYYLVCSPEIREPAIKSMVGSSGRQRVQIDVVQNLEICVPSYSKQKVIGETLKAFDDKIAINNKINNVLQNQAFAMFAKMMSNHQAEKNRLLSDYADINPRRSIQKNVEARCIDMTRLSTTGSFPDGWEYKAYTGGMKFSNGDTIMARITPCLENGKAAFINFLNDGEMAFGSTEYVVLSSRGKVPSELLYCLVRYQHFINYAVKNMNGTSGRQRVSGEAIGQYPMPQFSDEELSEFESFTRSSFEIIKRNSIENIKLGLMRDCLMPKLMSGKMDILGD